MLDDVGLQQRQRVVLGLVGRAHHGPDDEIGVDEFDDVAFVTGEQLRPRFPPMAHLRVAQRGHAVGGHATPDPPRPRRRVGLQVLRQHAPQRGERGLHRGRLADRHVGGHPRLHAVDLGQEPGQGVGLRRRIPPLDVQGGFETRGTQERHAGALEHFVARDPQRGGGARHHGAQRAPQEIPRIFHAARPHQRGRIQRRAQRLPAEAARLFRQRHGTIEQFSIEVVRDHPLAKFHERALRKRGVGRAQTPQHQLPALVHPGGHHRFRIADLVVGL